MRTVDGALTLTEGRRNTTRNHSNPSERRARSFTAFPRKSNCLYTSRNVRSEGVNHDEYQWNSDVLPWARYWNRRRNAVAPKSGAKTRKNIRNKAQEGAYYVKGQAQEAASAASNLFDHGVAAMRTRREGLKAEVDAGRSAYRETVATVAGAAANS